GPCAMRAWTRAPATFVQALVIAPLWLRIVLSPSAVAVRGRKHGAYRGVRRPLGGPAGRAVGVAGSVSYREATPWRAVSPAHRLRASCAGSARRSPASPLRSSAGAAERAAVPGEGRAFKMIVPHHSPRSRMLE